MEELAAGADILPAGMLADALKRRLHGTRGRTCASPSVVRSLVCRRGADGDGEVRSSGAPETLDIALSAVGSARAVAGKRALTGFSWGDIERFAGDGRVGAVLARFRSRPRRTRRGGARQRWRDRAAALEQLRKAGFERSAAARAQASARDRAALWHRGGRAAAPLRLHRGRSTAAALAQRVQADHRLRRVKAVRDFARLAAPQVPHVQVDWLRYGPKRRKWR